jgi:hypothetical protein
MSIDANLLAIGLRELERLLIVAGGIVAVVLGYRLFINLPMLEQRGTGKIQLPGGVSIYLSRIGPGVFFALFGTGVLAYSLQMAVQFDAKVPSTLGAPTPGAALAAAYTEVHYSGITGGAAAADRKDQAQAERKQSEVTVLALADITKKIEAHSTAKLDTDALLALEDARDKVMAAVWNDAEWGSRGEFEAWRNGGMKEPIPKSIARAVEIFSGSKK